MVEAHSEILTAHATFKTGIGSHLVSCAVMNEVILNGFDSFYCLIKEQGNKESVISLFPLALLPAAFLPLLPVLNY